MVIDFHTHIFPPRIKQDRAIYLSDPLFKQLYTSAKAKLATVDDLIESMDKTGIDRSAALNISWRGSERCRETNNYIMEAAARYPERIIGFGTVDPSEPEEAAGEIERCAKSGLKGIGEMRLERSLFSPENRSILDRFVQTLTENRMILLIHCSEPVGHQYQGKGDTTPELIYRLISDYPELSLVCAHWGGGLPFYALMPEVKNSLTKVVFDTAASPFLYTPDIYGRVADFIGKEKIVFGTDYPLVEQSRGLKEVRAQCLPTDQEECLLFRNAQHLLER
jgi:hypothetical protein